MALVPLILAPVGCGQEELDLSAFLAEASGVNFTVEETFGQLRVDSGTDRVANRIAVRINPATAKVRTPSTGVVVFEPSLGGMTNCLVLSPTARSSGPVKAKPGLPKPAVLKIVLANFETAGLRVALDTLFEATGDLADAPAVTAAVNTFLDPAVAKDQPNKKLSVSAPPESNDAAIAWSELGPAAGGALHIAAYSWSDANDDDQEQESERLWVNPAPYLVGRIPFSLVQKQPPTIDALKVEFSESASFATVTGAFDFNVADPTVKPANPLKDFIRFRMKLAEHAPGGGAPPTTIPYGVDFTLWRITRDSGGGIESREPERGSGFLMNTVRTSDTTARAGDLYHPDSDVTAGRYWLFVPTTDETTSSSNLLQSSVPFALDTTSLPGGEYEVWLEFTREQIVDRPPEPTVSAFFEVVGPVLEFVRDAAGDHVIDTTDPVIDHVEIGRWGADSGTGLTGYDGAAPPQPVNSAPPTSFIDRDPERFYVRLRSGADNADASVRDDITVKIRSEIPASVGTPAPDDNATDIRLRETGPDTGVFVSQAQLAMSTDHPTSADDDLAVRDGFGSAPGDDAAGDRTHRVAWNGEVIAAHTSSGGAVTSATAPFCRRPPNEERKILDIRVHVFNEPFRDFGIDGIPTNGDAGEGNNAYDVGESFTDISGDGVRNTVLGPAATATAHVTAQIDRSNMAWAQACIHVEQPGATLFEEAPNTVGGVNILADGAFNYLVDGARVVATAAGVGFGVLEVYFAGPIPGANGVAFPPLVNNPPFSIPVVENSFVFIGKPAVGLVNINHRTLAHELGHVLMNQGDSANRQYIFSPALTTHLDDKRNRYRRLQGSTVTTARMTRAAGVFTLGTGNRMLRNP